MKRCARRRWSRDEQARISPDRLTGQVEFDPAMAIKFTMRRTIPSGSAGDTDIFGSQQYGPLLEVEIPD